MCRGDLFRAISDGFFEKSAEIGLAAHQIPRDVIYNQNEGASVWIRKAKKRRVS